VSLLKDLQLGLNIILESLMKLYYDNQAVFTLLKF